MKILVTGAGGQLASALEDLSSVFDIKADIEFSFMSKKELDITDRYNLITHLTLKNYDYVINTAAYTNVDGAETSKELATMVNSTAVENLAIACNSINATLVHISTDYVFLGDTHIAYKETDNPNPGNHYGLTKMLGEKAILKHSKKGAIIRTSWLFHWEGDNFVRKILTAAYMATKKGDTKPLRIVSDQIGAPTSASHLARFILNRIKAGDFAKPVEIYNYTNSGIASWYDLAVAAVFSFNDRQQGFAPHIDCSIEPISTADYPTPASRPAFSLLDLTKIRKDFEVIPEHWLAALQGVTDFVPETLLML